MSWEYGESGKKEDRRSVRLICHHCGEPLSRENASVIPDPAFTAIEKSNAVHCFDCRRKYHHPIASRIESRLRQATDIGEVMTRVVNRVIGAK